MDGGLSSDFADGVEKRDVFWTDPYAVLRVAAGSDAAFFHHRIEADFFLVFSGGMHVEEGDLPDGCGPDEVVGVAVLRTGFTAASAGHAAGEEVSEGLCFLRDFGSGAEMVASVEFDPRVDFLE